MKQVFLIVDDHEAILQGTIPPLQKAYPETQIVTAQDYQAAKQEIELYKPSLVILDLSIPEKKGNVAKLEVGLNLLQDLLSSSLAPNIAVVSSHLNALIRLKASIKAYEGGFASIDKSLPIDEMLFLIKVAMRGSIFIPEKVKSRPEFHHKWLKMLQLKFEQALTDKEIAKQMNISPRTIRNYWIRIQDTLALPDNSTKEMRIQIEIEVRKMGLID